MIKLFGHLLPTGPILNDFNKYIYTFFYAQCDFIFLKKDIEDLQMAAQVKYLDLFKNPKLPQEKIVFLKTVPTPEARMDRRNLVNTLNIRF